MLSRMVIFGASGDLTARLLVPTLAELRAAGDLDDGFAVTGVAREEWSDDDFRERMHEALVANAPDVGDDARKATVGMLSFRQADVTDAASVAAVTSAYDEPFAAYLALPPALFEPTLSALADAGVPAGSVVAIEKPFGEDLASARRLNRLLAQRFADVTVFRNDHFLHNQTVQNILGLRFANRLFEPVWNADHVECVDVMWDETLALEGRAGYYDRSGALRDMLQNHLLQVLCFVAMEPPASMDARDLGAAKLAVLRAVPTPSPDDVRRRTARGRYTAGTVDGDHVPSYVDEEGVDPGRGTETFAQATLRIANWRWSGVPFTLRSGKAMPANRAEVIVRFRDVPHPTFAAPAGATPNVLRLRMRTRPSADIGININAEGDLFGLTGATLSADLPTPRLSAYAGLVRDVLAGDVMLSVGADEAEEAWRVMEAIGDGWAADVTPLRAYPAGSDVPDQWRTGGALV
jgi:glucose-6-phosphate 1-dehydrogenase